MGHRRRTAMVEEEVFGPSGAAALYRRSWLVRLGGFDESFFCYFEDVDLNLRLQVAGGRCLYVPSARIRHVGGASTGGLSAFTIYHSQRNLVWTFVKSTPPHIFWRYLPMHLLLNVGSIVSYGVRGHTKTLLRAKRDALRGLPAMVRARRSVMASREFDRAHVRRPHAARRSHAPERDALLDRGRPSAAGSAADQRVDLVARDQAERERRGRRRPRSPPPFRGCR